MYVGIMFNEFISSHLSLCVSVRIGFTTLAFKNSPLLLVLVLSFLYTLYTGFSRS